MKQVQADAPNAIVRLAHAARRIWGRVFSRPRQETPLVWDRRMWLLALVAILAVAAAAPFDPHIAAQFGKSRAVPVVFLRSVTDAVQSHFYLIPAFIVMVLVTVLNHDMFTHGQKRTAIVAYGRSAFIFFAIALPGIGINIVKQLVGRARPYTMDEVGPYAFHPFEFQHAFQSFPSGHSTTAGALAMILALWFPAWRWPIWVFGLVLASARIAANAHYASDVVAGFSIGMISTLCMARYLARRGLVFRFFGEKLMPKLRE